MSWRRIVGVAVMLGGAAVLVMGLFGMGAYVYGVIDVLDEADRSWLFWGLALLFGGLFLTAVGGMLLLWGWLGLRSLRADTAD